MFSKVLGKKEKEVETSLIEEFWYPKYGPGQLWETLAEELEKLGVEEGDTIKILDYEFEYTK